MEQLRACVESILPQIIAIRRDLHRHPEPGDCEERTAARAADRLRSLGLSPRTGVGGHGVVAEIAGDAPGPVIALRGDMDALPIQELGDAPWRSENAGFMHACGHDGHTAILLGVAETLLGLRSRLAGTVRLLFQPAEETVSGALRMLADGALEGVERALALHGWPGTPLGSVGLKVGPAMAGADTFSIRVRGRGAHAAYPHLSADPIVAAAHIVIGLQSIVSREVDPVDSAVITVAQIHAGRACNIIPSEAELHGTVRTLLPGTRAAMPGRIERVAAGIAAAHGAESETQYMPGTAPLMNDPAMVAVIREAATEALGADSVVDVPYATMGAEDFSFMLERAPGAMFRLGLGDTSPLHTPTFDFPDGAIGPGITALCATALRLLAPA